MRSDSEAINALCSGLGPEDGPGPLTAKERGDLSRALDAAGLAPGDILGFSSDDFERRLGLARRLAGKTAGLLARREELAARMEALSKLGIGAATIADEGYPARIRRVLGHRSPPLFYYAGSLDLLGGRLFGFAGARDADEEALRFTRRTVAKIARRGLGVVSGGAAGVDSAAASEALRLGAPVVEILPAALAGRLRSKAVAGALRSGRLLLLSAASPDAPFTAARAMMRNRLIYAQSEATLAVSARLGKGGTWHGAMDNLRHRWTLGLCWDNRNHEGNRKLIEMGAVPVADDWDGDLESLRPSNPLLGQPELF